MVKLSLSLVIVAAAYDERIHTLQVGGIDEHFIAAVN
jgi:hypothetical protein